MKKHRKISNVTITGGEPLLDYDFVIEIFIGIAKKEIKKTILTNAKLLNDARMEELRRLNADLRISIDSLHESNNEKIVDNKLIKLIQKYRIEKVSKVITKRNLKWVYEDIVGLVNLGFKDVDIIPQMYLFWKNEERRFLIKQLQKIAAFCLRNHIRTNLFNTNQNRYFRCDKIRILPDGDISFCNSLNSTRKVGYIKPNKLNCIEEFKRKIVEFALENYRKKGWFKEQYLNQFCMIDAFYHNFINNKSDKWLISSVELFLEVNKKINQIQKENGAPNLYKSYTSC